MKIAFPLISEQELAKDFAHSAYIGIYDNDSQKIDFIPLEDMEKAVSITTFFDTLTCLGLKSVASSYYNPLSIKVFKENNIETLKATSSSLSENIEQYKAQALAPFNLSESVIGSSCSGSCNSCSTSCSDN